MTTAALGMMIAVGDYEGDLDAITDVLNSMCMTIGSDSDDRAQWTVYGDGTIGFHGFTNEYPTVYPALEIVAVAQELPVEYETGVCAYYERLVIRSSGSAERHHYWAGARKRGAWDTDASEHYDPTAKNRVA